MEFNFPSIQADKNDRLAVILQEKFSLVAAQLQPLLKRATKGNRKDKLIFRPEAANLTWKIEDKFIQYVVRAIYDNYNDQIKKVRWIMHCNEWLKGSFIRGIFCKLDPTIDNLYHQLEAAEKLHSGEIHSLHDQEEIYDPSYWKRSKENVFRRDNPKSEPFWDEYHTFKEKVMTEHPRIQRFRKYVDDHYNLRQEYERIVKDHQERFPEHKNIQDKKSELYQEQWDKTGRVKIEIEKHMMNENYTMIEKQLKIMVNDFIQLIANSIINDTI